jgi:NADH:ubiquinone oxidoreductase subunit E
MATPKPSRDAHGDVAGVTVEDLVTVQAHGRTGEHRSPEEAARVPRFAHGSRVPGWDRAVDLAKDPSPVPDPATTPVPEELRAEIEAHMAKYPDRRSAAIPALAAAQRRHGWCSPEAIEQVATVMQLTPGYLTAVATFYDMFDTEPVGRHRVYVCTNISCSLNGADALYERFVSETGDDGDFHVRHFECLGACDIAPMASVDGVYVGPLELDDVPAIVEDLRNGLAPLPAKQLITRRSADPGAGTPQGPTQYGAEMPGDAPGPPAPFEQPPDPPGGQATA